jgi:hypothetical protein
MLRDGTVYQDLGPSYFDRVDRPRTTKSLVRRLEKLGYHVELESGPGGVLAKFENRAR